MKKRETSKKIDDLGRVVIPRAYLMSLNIEGEDKVKISLLSEGVFIEKIHKICLLCGNDVKLVSWDYGLICMACIEKIKKEYS